jgi:cyclohexanone monooxygenase
VPGNESHVDAVVIGAGFSGLYATKCLHDAGLAVAAFDAADDVGGVWRWNGYPGAQTDSPQETYRFTFANDLLKEWEYSHKYPPRAEVLAYLGHIADIYDLRRHYTFGARVKTIILDNESGLWTVTTDVGRAISAPYVVAALGLVSEPVRPTLVGLGEFEGEIYYSSSWPDEGAILDGKRVAIVGTGSSGIQLTPQIAKVARELTVFQRTPNYVVPTGNREVTDEDRAVMRNSFDDIARRVRGHPVAFPFERSTGRLAVDTSHDDRERIFEEMWRRGGFSLLFESFDDVNTDRRANELVCDFIRRKIHSIVNGPRTADMLTPHYPYGAKRPPTGDDYYEAFNLGHVRLVDIRQTPIIEVTPDGIRTSETLHELDVIIFATGFDVATGSFFRIDVRGRGGRSIREHWAAGPSTYLGIAIAGFPNFFMVTGPQSPFANLPPCAEASVGWIVGVIDYMRSNARQFIEPLERAEQSWVRHVSDVAERSFVLSCSKSVNSWFTGANIEGKPKVFNVYFGGQNKYLDQLDAEAAERYPGFLKYQRLSEVTT